MTTAHETAATAAAEDWLRTLPKEVRSNTLTTQTIKEHWLTNSPRQLALAFVDAVQQRVWLQVAYMPAVESKRAVRTYSPLEWMRECIGAEPDELMRTVAGHLPSAEEGSAAAVSLIQLMRDEDPDTLRELCKDYRHAKATCRAGTSCLECSRTLMASGVRPKPNCKRQWWATRQAQSEDQENPAHRAGNNPTWGHWKPKDRKSRLIRTLTNLENNPDECQRRARRPKHRSSKVPLGAGPHAFS